MNIISDVASIVWNGVKEVAGNLWGYLARSAFDWLLEGLERLVQRVVNKLRIWAEARSDEGTVRAMGVTVVDSMVISLARIQEELVLRRETLTAEGALVIFQSQLEPAQAGI